MPSKTPEQGTAEVPSGLQQKPVRQRSDSGVEKGMDFVADEVPVALSYNGETHAVMMASPIDLEDFAYGFSLTEGIIKAANDVRSINIERARKGIAIQIAVAQQQAEKLKQRRRSLAGRAGCGICGLTELSAAVPDLVPLDGCSAPSHTAIKHAAQALGNLQALQQVCGGIHGAALCDNNGENLLVREDVGRHNALDKLIGAALRSERPIQADDFVLMSSRGSHELVNKCVLAGVNSLVTLSAATSLAIDVATKAHLNLIGFVRGDRQNIYFQNEV